MTAREPQGAMSLTRPRDRFDAGGVKGRRDCVARPPLDRRAVPIEGNALLRSVTQPVQSPFPTDEKLALLLHITNGGGGDIPSRDRRSFRGADSWQLGALSNRRAWSPHLPENFYRPKDSSPQWVPVD